ncbi:MAG: hypothetical protein GKR94_33000 [Gammaproteobacteria bacterium]|nr:hypothetical protein [Gammaproteobacteria bacterium]
MTSLQYTQLDPVARILESAAAFLPAYEPERPIFVRTFGPLTIHIGEEHLEPTGRARALLVELFARGGHAVPAATVAGALWPHGETGYALGALNNTLYRMRRKPGMTKLVTLTDGRLTLDSRQCDIDRWILEAALDTATTILELGDPQADHQELERLLALAVAVYRGPLLEHEQSEAARNARQRIRRRLAHVMTRAEHWLARTYAAATDWLARLVAVDPVPEFMTARA